MIKKYARDEKLIQMENLFESCIKDYLNNYSIGKIGKLFSLFNGEFKNKMAAIKLQYETYDNIANHLITVIKISNIETFVDYQNKYIWPIAKKYFRPGFKTDLNKTKKRINALIKNGKITGFIISSEGDFVKN